MEIKFNIEKKHFYFITILLTLVVVGLFVNANVDTSQAWHNIQQIATDNTGAKNLDENTNAIVDEADYAYSGGYWSEDNGNVYYSSGNVGIGTSNPGVFKLNVEGGPTRFNGQLNIDGGYAEYSILRLLKGSFGSNIFMEDKTGNVDVIISSVGDSYFNGGNVGIGTTTPTRKLDVNGDITASGFIDRENFYYFVHPGGISEFKDIRSETIKLGGKTRDKWYEISCDWEGWIRTDCVSIENSFDCRTYGCASYTTNSYCSSGLVTQMEKCCSFCNSSPN